MSKKATVLQRADGRLVGLVKDGVLVKKVKGSRHKLRRPPAWAIDKAVLDVAEKDGATKIEIHDTESGEVFCCAVADFRAKCFSLNRGFGEQLALALAYWLPPGVTAKPEPPKIEQPMLLEV